MCGCYGVFSWGTGVNLGMRDGVASKVLSKVTLDVAGGGQAAGGHAPRRTAT